jgi:hypothetical protein
MLRYILNYIIWLMWIPCMGHTMPMEHCGCSNDSTSSLAVRLWQLWWAPVRLREPLWRPLGPDTV